MPKEGVKSRTLRRYKKIGKSRKVAKTLVQEPVEVAIPVGQDSSVCSASSSSKPMSKKRSLTIFPKKRKLEPESTEDEGLEGGSESCPGPSAAGDCPAPTVNMIVNLGCLGTLVSNQKCSKCSEKVGQPLNYVCNYFSFNGTQAISPEKTPLGWSFACMTICF